ncbi:hypothetical protein LZ496_01155 [Sphingomonas sp. NSE70-1]|uniref:HicB family protein n=1 Tax=Sphingomonas caseinilyticus TaxID=2908205 RepID=A0ABT0RQV2_9SPHN|nr:hypothetical protein [Sphingomonas caseinilyticus]MCL6697398.1 hypothetical protein [Sphingomonas caseinilyticus]
MGEPKAFASLSSGLLARKGAARPAMRPQGFGAQSGAGLEDLGWNDMGFEPPKPVIAPVLDEDHDAFGEELPDQPLRNPLSALTPIASPVHDQQAEIQSRFANHDEDGEDEDGEYVDETAELYDPEADDTAPVLAEPEPVAFKPEPIASFDPEPIASFEPAPAPAPVRARRPRAQPGAKGKAAFTLRLDPSRHLKLRLACAVNGRSAQQLVTDALDQLLKDMPELESMAERAPRKSA